MVLFFLRHGVAADEGEWPGTDETRPLTQEGRRALEGAVIALGAVRDVPPLIVSSPLARARQTADSIAGAFAPPRPVIEDEHLRPGFGSKDLADVVRSHRHDHSLILVGHEDDFSATIGELTGTRMVCKKGGLIRVDVKLNAGDFTDGKVVWALTPTLLSLLAEWPPGAAGGKGSPRNGTALSSEQKEETAMNRSRRTMKKAAGYSSLIVTAAPVARRLLSDRRLRRDMMKLAKSWRRVSGDMRGSKPAGRAREMLDRKQLEHLAQRMPSVKSRRARLPIAGAGSAVLGAGAVAGFTLLKRRPAKARGSVHVLGRTISGEVRMKKAA
jgi:phosphohistidine phosphatase